MHVLELWEVAGEPSENPSRHVENMQTPRRGGWRGRESNAQPHGCEAAAWSGPPPIPPPVLRLCCCSADWNHLGSAPTNVDARLTEENFLTPHRFFGFLFDLSIGTNATRQSALLQMPRFISFYCMFFPPVLECLHQLRRSFFFLARCGFLLSASLFFRSDSVMTKATLPLDSL